VPSSLLLSPERERLPSKCCGCTRGLWDQQLCRFPNSGLLRDNTQAFLHFHMAASECNHWKGPRGVTPVSVFTVEALPVPQAQRSHVAQWEMELKATPPWEEPGKRGLYISPCPWTAEWPQVRILTSLSLDFPQSKAGISPVPLFRVILRIKRVNVCNTPLGCSTLRE